MLIIKKYKPDRTVRIPINPNMLFIQHVLLSILFGNFFFCLRKYKSIPKFIGKIISKKMEKVSPLLLDNDRLVKKPAMPIMLKKKLIIRSKIMTT